VDDKPRCVPQEDNDSESSKEHLAKLVTPDTSSEKEVVWLELERLIELERELLAMRAGKAERDRRIAQLTDQLVQKSALLEQAEANVAEAKKRAGLEQRELQAKLDELLLSRDRAEANAAEAKKRAGLEQRELQAKLDESLLSRDQAEANAAEAKKRAELEQHDLQAKLDELLLSRDQAFGQAQSALQKATFRAAEANERSQRELAEVHVKLEARESELAAVRLRLTDAEDGWAKSKVEAGTSRVGTQAAAGLVDMDMDRVIWRLMERVRVVEAEMASLRGNEKSIESMECRNEG
jgi:low affinity Fe/Cu permease